MLAAFQTMKLDKAGTDCQSTHYLKVYLDPSYKKFFLYRYIKKGSGLLLLTPENIDEYVNTYISLRSPMYCKNKDKFCNICAGEYFYMLGIDNLGLTANRISGSALNNSLKKFHDMTVHTKQIDWKKYVV
jgi:hypothetical protein